jgi:hypothetical protein
MEFSKGRRARIAVICVAILGLSVLYILFVGALPGYMRFTLGVVSGVPLFAVEIMLLKRLFRILGIHRLSLVLGLGHFLLICGFTVLVYHGSLVDPGYVMMWVIPGLIDMPVSILGVVIMPLMGDVDLSTGIEIWGPGVFFAVFGSLQYYLVGRLAEAHRETRASGRGEAADAPRVGEKN